MSNYLRRVVFKRAATVSVVTMMLAVSVPSQPKVGAMYMPRDLVTSQSVAATDPVIVHHWPG